MVQIWSKNIQKHPELLPAVASARRRNACDGKTSSSGVALSLCPCCWLTSHSFSLCFQMVDDPKPTAKPSAAILRGRVQSGKNDANKWLSQFARAYESKLGIRTGEGQALVPGSLNVKLETIVSGDVAAEAKQPPTAAAGVAAASASAKPLTFPIAGFASTIRMNGSEYGGARDILMLPVRVRRIQSAAAPAAAAAAAEPYTAAWIWRTTNGERDEAGLLELIATRKFRASPLQWADGDLIEMIVVVEDASAKPVQLN
jgi:hypothetical protein